MLPRRLLQLFGFESRLNRRERLPRRVPLLLEPLEDRTLLSANLSLSLSAPSTALVGDQIVYSLTVTNSGSAAATGVTLTDYLPSGETFQSQAQTGGPIFALNDSGGGIDDTISSLAAAASASFSVTALVNSGDYNGQVLSDMVSVSAAGVSSAAASVSTTVHIETDLGVSVTAPAAVLVGGEIVYAVEVSNGGPSAAPSVTVADTLPSGVTFSSQTQTGGPTFTLSHSGASIDDTISSLAAGASATFDFVATVNTGVANGTVLDDTASIASSYASGGSSSSASVSTTAYSYGPVSLTNPGTQTSTEGNTVSLSISASDAGIGTLSYGASGLPAGLRINPSTGAITGTVAVGDAASDPYSVTVTAGDGLYSAQTTFTWNVASPVTLTNPGDRTNAEGDIVSLSISASDSSGGTLVYSAAGLPDGLAINTGTGAVSGTVAVGDAAELPYSVTVTANDGTYSASATFDWTVTGPVRMAPIADQTSTEGNAISLAVSATDTTSGATLVYTAAGLPPGLTINSSNGSISGTVAAGDRDYSVYDVTVAANDGTSRASRGFAWTVNSPITLTAPADPTNAEGDVVSLAVSASDSSGGTITYGAVGLPAGLSMNASTGVISGTVATGDAAEGSYDVTLLAGDGTYRNTAAFTWDVGNGVTFPAPADQSNAAGDVVSLAVNASYAGGTLSYSASGLPNGLSINASTGVIAGTLSAGGSFTPTVTATYGSTSASVQFNWAVSSPITISDPGPQAYNAGDAVSLPIVATDTAAGTLSYSASGLPSGLSINSGSGLISGTISSSLAAGVAACTVTVSDGTNTAVASFAWTLAASGPLTVANPGAQSSTEGASVSLSVGVSYSGSGTLAYAADGLPPGLTINPSTGSVTGTVAGGDSFFGPYAVTVTATDGTATDRQDFTWTVSSPVSLTNPGVQSSTEGGSVSLSLSASYTGSLTYSATGLPGGLTINASTGAITGTVAAGAAADGPYEVTVQAASGAYAADQTFAWNVASPVTITTPADPTNNEGDTVSLSLSASDSVSGATLSYAALGLPNGLKINTSTGAISGTVAVGAAADGPYDVTVVAQDGTYSSSVDFTWNINSPVTITTPADPTSTEGASASLTLSASDTVSGATLSYAALGLPPGLTINPSSGAISGTVTAGDAANGPYEVTVSAADGTYSASTDFTWTIGGPVAITIPADQTNNQGDTVSLTVGVSNSAGGTLSYAATDLPSGLSINSSTGVISGTLSDGGWWEPVVTVGNGTYSDTESFGWTVNSFVSITDPGDQLNQIGDVVSVKIAAADEASSTLSYSASGLPSGLSINSSTGVISGTVGTGASTTTPYSTTVTVSDGTNTAVDSFAWSINPAGPVSIVSIAAQTSTAGSEVAMPVQVGDTAGGTLLFSAVGLPAGLYINPVTGLIFGTVSASAVSGTAHSVTVTAADGSHSASLTFNWTVNAAGTVTLANPGDQTSSEGATVAVSLSGTDSGSGTLSYAAFGLPAGLKINPSTGAITGTVAISDAVNGPYDVTVVANDGTTSATQEFAWNVNDPVTITQPADQTNNEGDSASLSISASDSTSGTLSYAALGLPPGLKINPSTGTITGTVAGGDAADGPYSVTVIAGDGTYSASQTFTWNVNSPITIAVPDTQTNNDGDTVSSMGIGATDSLGGTLTYSAQGLPPGLAINPSTGVISGTIALGDSSIGTFYPTLIVSDGTYTAVAGFEWDVNGAVVISDPGGQANVVGDTVTLPIDATDTAGGTLSYAAAGLPAGLSINTSTGAITGTVASAAASVGDYTTTVTVGDGTNTASDTFDWAVSAAGLVTLATPASQTSSENATASLSLSASDSVSGATLHYFAEGLPPGLVISPSSGAISGTVAVGDAAYSVYTVTVIATDGALYAEATFGWTISAHAAITTIADQSNREGDTVSLTLSASDPGGTLHFTAVGLPPGLQINTSTGAISGTIALDAAALGTYEVMVTAGDGTYSVSQVITWNVTSPVTVTGVADQSNDEGDTPTLTVSDADSISGATLRYAATGLPAGLSINTATGAISGSIAAGAAAFGPYTVVVTANDGTYSASTTFAWNVNDPITITTPADEVFSAGGLVDLLLGVTDAHGGTLHYTATGLPAGLAINAVTGAITGTISDTLAAAGSFVSTIVATDGTFTNTLSIDWAVLVPALGLSNQDDKNPIDVSLWGIDQVMKDAETQKFIKQGSAYTWTKQTVNDKNVIVEGTKGKDAHGEFYNVRFFLGLSYKDNVGGKDVMQLLDILETNLDKDGKNAIPPAQLYKVEGLPIVGGVANDPRAYQLSLYVGKIAVDQVRITSSAFVGTYDGKTTDKRTIFSEQLADWKKVKPLVDSGPHFDIDFSLNDQGEWTLTSKDLGIKEKGQIK